MIFSKLNSLINELKVSDIVSDRHEYLNKLVEFIQEKRDKKELINLNFICTHNSRRSHLSQIWAQTMASFYNLENVFCYSGGTEATAMYQGVEKTLVNQGFEINRLTGDKNPIYAIKFSGDHHPIVAFSKTFDDAFNPNKNFAAIMTCSHADENCPFIIGAEKRLPIRYEDPKAFDDTPIQMEKYEERSLQVATEMKYIFSKIK